MSDEGAFARMIWRSRVFFNRLSQAFSNYKYDNRPGFFRKITKLLMAVKKHVGPEGSSQLDLPTLAAYLHSLTNQPFFLPEPTKLVQQCHEIVECLARATVQKGDEEVREQLQIVQSFYLSVMTSSMPEECRREIITTVLDKFHSLVSDPLFDACPATSIVLIVFDGAEEGEMAAAARFVIQRWDSAGVEIRTTLSTLYRWTYQWYGTPALGHWIMAFIKALEENENYDILIEVSLENIENMFKALKNPKFIKRTVADVILHVLGSMRESTEALNRISPHVDGILLSLASQCDQWSRQLLQNVVDILKDYLDRFNKPKSDKYAKLVLCLERHMASQCCPYLQIPGWKDESARDDANATATNTNPTNSNAVQPQPATTQIRKVGLTNLGNTCYMNSVMQALLITRHFSTHVVLRMQSVPYWQRVGALFAKLIHSMGVKLNPEEIFYSVKPPFFNIRSQHDSSEFLGYLFELLFTYEHVSDLGFDYTHPHIVNAGYLRAGCILPNQTPGGPRISKSLKFLKNYIVFEWANRDFLIASRKFSIRKCCSRQDQSVHLDSDDGGEGSNSRRSTSPRPGSSGTVARSSGPSKRITVARNINNDTLKKRLRATESYLRQNSFIDSLFGGVLVTRIECSICEMPSISRDLFRDLQLAFPEKPEPGKNHSVQSLLDFYCSVERLTGENRYECHACGQFNDAERSVLIETPPKYLILVLKNFKFEAKSQAQSKLMHKTHYDQTVTLPTVRNQAVQSNYVLYAAVVHSGTSLNSGHYYTLGKENDQWYQYNDESVMQCSEHELNSLPYNSTPYILFYRRADIVEIAAPLMSEMPESLQEMVMAHNKQVLEDLHQLRGPRP